VTPSPDAELVTRQAALQAEAEELLRDPELAERLAVVGPLLTAGSFVSGLMSWRDLDLMAQVGPGWAPGDTLDLMRSLIGVPGVIGLAYSDERGHRSPTGEARDERYHVVITIEREAPWRLDLTLWLNDPHVNVVRWHEALRDSITPAARLAVLRIKDVWHRRPEYPDEVGGTEIYAAVLDHGVRTADGFGEWLAGRERDAAGG
jgi:hypothetical protein